MAGETFRRMVRNVGLYIQRSLIAKTLIALCLVMIASASGVFADSATVSGYNINWNNNSSRAWPARVVADGSTGVSGASYSTNLSLQGNMDLSGPNGGYCSFSDTYQTTNGSAYSGCEINLVNGYHTAYVNTTHSWNAYGLNTTRTKSTVKAHP
jgi:hypothetical protein